MEVSEGPPGVQAQAEPPPPPPELPAFPSAPRPLVARSAPERAPEASAEGWVTLLTNRFILAALGVVAVLLLTAIVLVAIGHGDSAAGRSSNVVAPANDKTPVRPIGGLAGIAVTTASYRNGPGVTYTILGTIPRGAAVAIVGRSEQDDWLQVRYPPGSTLKGWVDAKLLDVTGDITVLAVAGPGPVASADITYVPTAAVYEPVATSTVEPEQEPTHVVVVRPTRTATVRPTVTPYRTPLPTPTEEPLSTQTPAPNPQQ